MNPELITRLVKLVEKTGDRVVLPDLETGKAVVVMNLDAYEQLTANASNDAKTSASSEAPAVDADRGASAPSAVVTPPSQPTHKVSDTPVQPTSLDRTEPPAPTSAEMTKPEVNHAVAQQSATAAPPFGLPVELDNQGVQSSEQHHVAPPAPAVHPETLREDTVPKTGEGKAKTKGLTDLTQQELLDRINRDIDDWKTAQDSRHTDELRSAVHDLSPSAQQGNQLEEEEHFFLEPIE